MATTSRVAAVPAADRSRDWARPRVPDTLDPSRDGESDSQSMVGKLYDAEIKRRAVEP